MLKFSSFLFLTLIGGTLLHAESRTYDFQDPKGVNNILFLLDAPLESINGSTTGISGQVTFDPEAPESLQGQITVDASTLRVGNPGMQKKMLGEEWLAVETWPEITFTLSEAQLVEQKGNQFVYDVQGSFELKGISKELSTQVTLTWLEDMLAKRGGGKEGHLLVLRSDFSINRNDYDIKPGQYEDKVANEILIKMSIAGASAH